VPTYLVCVHFIMRKLLRSQYRLQREYTNVLVVEKLATRCGL